MRYGLCSRHEAEPSILGAAEVFATDHGKTGNDVHRCATVSGSSECNNEDSSSNVRSVTDTDMASYPIFDSVLDGITHGGEVSVNHAFHGDT